VRRLKSLEFDDFDLETVDVVQDPMRAKRDRIRKTPMVAIANGSGGTRCFPSLTQADDYELKYALGLKRLW